MGLVHWLSQIVQVVLILETCNILQSLQINEGWTILLNDTKFMITCSFTIKLKKVSACSKVFVG
jgi:hypothetical protein